MDAPAVSLCVIYIITISVGPSICNILNPRPIIGVLAQQTDPIFGPNFGDTYILATYIKWLESGGARVVPIRVKESDEYYEKLFKSINGLVIPGGIVSIETSYYAKASRLLYNMAVRANDANDYFPLWGTCRGFQQLTALTSGKDLVSTCSLPSYKTTSLNLTHNYTKSRLLADLPTDILTSLTSYNVAPNHHIFGLSPANFSQNEALRTFYRVLSTNVAENGKEFISTIEAIGYPFYGSQWHPEKVPYKWDLDADVTHTERGVKVSQYFANFFVGESKKSGHRFPDINTEISTLINNYHTYFTKDTRFVDRYFFNFTEPHF